MHVPRQQPTESQISVWSLYDILSVPANNQSPLSLHSFPLYSLCIKIPKALNKALLFLVRTDQFRFSLGTSKYSTLGRFLKATCCKSHCPHFTCSPAPPPHGALKASHVPPVGSPSNKFSHSPLWSLLSCTSSDTLRLYLTNANLTKITTNHPVYGIFFVASWTDQGARGKQNHALSKVSVGEFLFVFSSFWSLPEVLGISWLVDVSFLFLSLSSWFSTLCVQISLFL